MIPQNPAKNKARPGFAPKRLAHGSSSDVRFGVAPGADPVDDRVVQVPLFPASGYALGIPERTAAATTLPRHFHLLRSGGHLPAAPEQPPASPSRNRATGMQLAVGLTGRTTSGTDFRSPG